MDKQIETNNRREFLKKSLGLAGIALCAGSMTALIESCSSTVTANGGTGTFDLTNVSQLAVDGGVYEYTWNGQFSSFPVIIIRENSSSYLAFSTVCPHEGEQLSYPSNSTSDLVCKAHNSHFSPKTGAKISGPTPSGLTKYTASYNAETHVLTVTG